MGGGSPNPTSIGSPIVERKPDGDFDLLMFGRNKVPRWFYLMSCFMVAVRASLSSFWILVSNQRTVPHDRLINVGDPFNRIMLNTCLWSW
jgi:hypothetical protein